LHQAALFGKCPALNKHNPRKHNAISSDMADHRSCFARIIAAPQQSAGNNALTVSHNQSMGVERAQTTANANNSNFDVT
jgi:hypothetical protein